MTPARSTVLSVALLAVSLGSLFSALQLTRLAPIAGGGTSAVGIGASPACPTTTSTPSAALDILAADPGAPLADGTTLSVSYELRALALPSGVADAPVEVPGVTAMFPMSSSASLQIFIDAQSLFVSEGAWTDVSGHSRTVAGTTTLDPNQSAQLSTQLLAVTTTAPVGSVDLEVRWSWSISGPGGASSSGPWTVPGTSGSFPSIFYPDPYVVLVGQSPAAERTGAYFSVQLSGVPAHTPFLLKLENSSTGATLNRAYFNSSSVADATFTGTIQLVSGSFGLPPGNYLVHVHDGCAGILYNLPVQVSYAVSGTGPSIAIAARPV
jgi:hypothetical protein